MIDRSNITEFEEIVVKYQKMVFRLVMGFVHVKEDAEDLTQETFIKAYHSWDLFRGDSEISTWLYRIAINVSLNHVERQKKRNLLQLAGDAFSTLFNLESEEKSPHQILEDVELSAVIRSAIDSLPEKQRIAFILSKYEELPQREIARIMKTTEGAVEQLLQRAKIHLRKKINNSVGKAN